MLDALTDAVVAADLSATICYANPAATSLLGYRPGELEGRSATALVPDDIGGWLADGFEAFARSEVNEVSGRRLAVSMVHRDGTELPTELVLSPVDVPDGRVVVAVLRPRSDERVQRWSDLTGELLDILTATPSDDPPAERLLSTLGRRLRWDVTTLWGVAPDGTLVCRHVWTRSPSTGAAFVAEKAKDPTHGGEGMPRWVVEHGEPLWVTDLEAEERFLTDAARGDGFRSACAFPVTYRGACLGVVKMLSTRRRQQDPELVELMGAVSGHVGELLHALEQAAEREQLVSDLREARRSQEFLLRASRVLSEASDYRQTVERLADVAVPVLADVCLIDIRNEHGAMERMAARHADPARQALVDRLRHYYAPDPAGTHPSAAVMRSGQSSWSATMSDEFLAKTSRDEEHLALLKELGFTSYMTVPLEAGGGLLGTVTLVSAGSGRRFSEKDLVGAEELAMQVASVVERARLHDREQQISHTLQRSLLPNRLPELDGWSLAARYLPTTEGAEVGGDWYDVIPLDRRTAAVVVGDVEGHDMEAASVMGRLRHALWLVMSEERSPGPALDRLNRFLLDSGDASGVERIATVLVATIDLGSAEMAVASAGHLPPLVVGGDGAEQIELRPGPPLGVPEARYRHQSVELGDRCVVLFTDGLVERAGQSLDAGLDRLREVTEAASGLPPDRLADHLLAEMFHGGPSADDVAMLAARRSAS
ncbi:MAG: SpoIIE family protein phosphatase [Acidimicrobiales bacterium]